VKQIDAGTWEDDAGQQVVSVHHPANCAGETCMIHNPTDHSMRDFRLVFRGDRMPLAERICPHGVGHPDPDCLDFLMRVNPEGAWEVHGCDGCCGETSA